MEYGSYGMHPGQFQPATPRPQMVVTLNDKFGSFFNELLKLATLKSNPSYSVFYIRKYIQDLLRGTLSLEDFVLQLRDIFGSHQPHLLHFLKSEHFFTQPYSLESPEGQAVANGDQYFPNGNESFKSEEQFFGNDSVEIPDLALDSSPIPPLSPQIIQPKIEPDNSNPMKNFEDTKIFKKKDIKPSKKSKVAATVVSVSEKAEIDEKKPAPVVASPVKPPKKSVYVEPIDTLLNSDALLKYCNKRRITFKSISQKAINCMAEFINVEIRVFANKVLIATKARQTAPLVDDDTKVVPNDIKTQINVLDSYYLSNDLKDAKTEEGKKMLDARNNRKRGIEEIHNVANEVALAALGGKKRNWGASSSKTSTSQAKAPSFIKSYRISAQDVIFAMHDDKRFQNSWAYRNSVRVHPFANGHAYSTYSKI